MAEVAAQRAVAAGVPAGGGEEADLAAAAMRGRGEVDTSSPFRSVRQAVDLFGGGAAAVSQWRHPQAPPPVQLRPEVSTTGPRTRSARPAPCLSATGFSLCKAPKWTLALQSAAAACSVAAFSTAFFPFSPQSPLPFIFKALSHFLINFV